MIKVFFRTLILFLFVINSGCDIEEVNIPPEPNVRIVAPTATTQILDSTKILIEASDDRGITKVDLYIDGKIPPGGTLLYEPYEYMWNTQQYADSSVHIVYARAFDTDSNSSESQKLSIVTYNFSPSNLQASVVNDTVLRFTWNDNTSQETGFQLFESINDSGLFLRKTMPANTVTTDINGIFVGSKQYLYMLRAVKDTLKSKFTNSQLVTIVLSPPAGLYMYSLTDTLIELRWQQGTNAFEQYVEVEERVGTGPYVKRGTIPSGTRSIQLSGHYKSGTNYSFRARAFSVYNVSGYSNVVTTNVPFPAPTNITILHTGPTAVRLAWKDNTTFEEGFAIERLTDGEASFAEVFRTGPNDTAWTDTSIDSTKSYEWRVRAFTDSNLSAYSPVIFASRFPTYTKKFDLTQFSTPVTAVRFVPNAPLMVTSHAGGDITVWNSDNGSPVRSIVTNSSGVFSLAVSSDGSKIASGGGDGTVTVWDRTTGATLHTFSGHTGRVTALDFASAGSIIISGGADKTIKIWDAGTGSFVSSINAHSDTVTSVRFHPSENKIVSGSKDNTVKYWNSLSGTVLWEKSFPVLSVNAISFNSSGSTIAVGQTASFGNPVILLHSANGDSSSFFNRLSTSSNAVVFHPDGVALASCGDDGYIGTFHLVRPFIYTNVSTGATPLVRMEFQSDGSAVATGDRNGIVTVYSVEHRWQKFNP